MGRHKVVKQCNYFSRFQPKFRRRRECKTDYFARKRLVVQDKNKYNTQKHRFVVRISNQFVTCQVVKASIAGDVVVAAAHSNELPKYGLKAGLKNYAACYCTGLLLARRVLSKLGLAETYEGNTDGEVGEDYNVETEGDARPLKCYLDTGLARTSTGARVFGALKGAVDGGLDIPHSDKRFAGWDKEGGLDSETHSKYIMGGLVAEYAEEMKEEDPEKYQKHFSRYLKAGQAPEDLEDVIEKVHEAIRAKPNQTKKARKKPAKAQRWKTPKLTYEQRKSALKSKLLALQAAQEESD